MSPASKYPLDEWSTYFNIAPSLHPNRFHDPETFVTLAWPENPGAWQSTVEPGAFLFENFFYAHYGPHGIFVSIAPDDYSLEASMERVVRWRQYELQLLSGIRDPLVGLALPKSLTQRVRQAAGQAISSSIRREGGVAVSALLRSSRRQ